MKSIISKIGALFLGVLILLSSLGFTVSTHFCGGEKIKSAIGFVKTDLTCGMKMKPSSCPDQNHVQSTCCQNVFEYHHIEDNVKKESSEIFIPDFSILKYAFNWNPNYNVRFIKKPFIDLSPPPIVRDIIIAHQTFLI